MRALRCVSVFLLVVIAACGDDDVRPLEDAGPRADTAIPVPPPRDMGPEDAGDDDMGPEDAGPEDAGPEDAGPVLEPCTRPGASEELVCGMCGTQTRFCTSARVWEYSSCEGEGGVCTAGDSGRIACGARMIDALCNSQCLWIPADRDDRCPLPSCGDARTVRLVAGDTVSVDLDTRYGEAGPLELGPSCGGAAPRAPQIVLSLDVPGSTSRLVDFSLVNDATQTTWDTIVQLRRGDCSAIPGSDPGAPGMPTASCWDDTMVPTGLDARSSGRFAATGGEPLFLVVTGFSFGVGMSPPDRLPAGIGRIEITVGDEVSPPTLRSATVAVSPELSMITIAGGDPDGDPSRVRITWLDAAGMPVDRNGDGATTGDDDSSFALDPTLAGMTSFTTTLTDPFLAATLEGRMVTRARVVLIDATGLESAPLTVDASIVTLATFGEPCDAMRVCRAPLLCTMGTCQASPEATAACVAATPLALMGTPASARVTAMLSPGPAALFTGSCGSTMGGPEALYRVTVPDGAWDLLVSTANPGTPMDTDTVLYLRRTCGDPRTESICVDDFMGLRSQLILANAMPGEQTIFVERFGGVIAAMPITYELSVTLRPVLAGGATCDPMGVADRCSTGPCTVMGMCPMPPPP